MNTTPATKFCKRCQQTLPVSQFHPHGSTRDRLQNECKTCHNERRQKARKEGTGFYATERERYHDSHLLTCRKAYYRARKLVFEHYSPGGLKCANPKCGYTDFRALTIDHIDGGGTKHRQEVGGIFYKWLVKQGFPPGYQVLCMNCQYIKRWEENGYSVV